MAVRWALRAPGGSENSSPSRYVRANAKGSRRHRGEATERKVRAGIDPFGNWIRFNECLYKPQLRALSGDIGLFLAGLAHHAAETATPRKWGIPGACRIAPALDGFGAQLPKYAVILTQPFSDRLN